MPLSQSKRNLPQPNCEKFYWGAKKKKTDETYLTLIDIHGEILASFVKEKPFKIKNTMFQAHINVDGLLSITGSMIKDNRLETQQRAIKNLKNEFDKRNQDLTLLETNILSLIVKIQTGGETEDFVRELQRMLLLKEQHKKRICMIQNQKKISITYKKISKIASVLVPKGVFTQLPWFQNPIMWYTEIEENVEEKVAIVTEEVPIQIIDEKDIHKTYLYAIGGFVEDSTSIMPSEKYDPDQDAWTEITPMSTERHAHGIAVLNDQIYVGGGFLEESMSATSALERYDPTHDKWISLALMDSKRAYFDMAVIQNQVYAVGGKNNDYAINDNIFASTERYDPDQNKWTYVAPMNCARYSHKVAVINNNLYAVGGKSSSQEYLSSAEKYDPNTKRWINIASMNYKRADLAVEVMDGELYAIGGQYGGSLSSVEKYNPKWNKWTPVAPMNTKRGFLSVTVVGGKLYAAGGDKDDHGELAVVECYNPSENKWTLVSPMNNERSMFGLVTVVL